MGGIYMPIHGITSQCERGSDRGKAKSAIMNTVSGYRISIPRIRVRVGGHTPTEPVHGSRRNPRPEAISIRLREAIC